MQNQVSPERKIRRTPHFSITSDATSSVRSLFLETDWLSSILGLTPSGTAIVMHRFPQTPEEITKSIQELDYKFINVQTMSELRNLFPSKTYEEEARTGSAFFFDFPVNEPHRHYPENQTLGL